jgi:hypothetical protein
MENTNATSRQNPMVRWNWLHEPGHWISPLPPKDDGDLTISGNLKSFEGPPVLNCRVSTTHRDCYLNELVIHGIRKNVSSIFHNFLSSCCKIRIRPVVVKIPESSVVHRFCCPQVKTQDPMGGLVKYRELEYNDSLNKNDRSGQQQERVCNSSKFHDNLWQYTKHLNVETMSNQFLNIYSSFRQQQESVYHLKSSWQT